MQPTAKGPEIDKQPGQEHMQRNAHINCCGKRQHQIQPVGWIEQGGLKASKVWHPRKDVRIPQGQVALAQLAETKLAPIDELRGQVGAPLGENHLIRRKQHIDEHEQRQSKENQKSQLERFLSHVFHRAGVAPDALENFRSECTFLFPKHRLWADGLVGWYGGK